MPCYNAEVAIVRGKSGRVHGAIGDDLQVSFREELNTCESLFTDLHALHIFCSWRNRAAPRQGAKDERCQRARPFTLKLHDLQASPAFWLAWNTNKIAYFQLPRCFWAKREEASRHA